MSFKTSDGQRIDTDFYQSQSAEAQHTAIAIVAPGFGQYRKSRTSLAICGGLSEKLDVLCMDFRGTGTSTGYYSFGEHEPLDLEPILSWAKGRYEKVNLIGLSIGAYAAGRAAVEWPGTISNLLLISCPTRVEDIITSGGVVDNLIQLLVSQGVQLDTGSTVFFRWGPIFGKKPNLAKIDSVIGVPVSFLVGESDHLVYEGLSRKVYEALPGEKNWDIFPKGSHADAMYIQDPQRFMSWIMTHLEL